MSRAGDLGIQRICVLADAPDCRVEPGGGECLSEIDGMCFQAAPNVTFGKDGNFHDAHLTTQASDAGLVVPKGVPTESSTRGGAQERQAHSASAPIGTADILKRYFATTI